MEADFPYYQIKLDGKDLYGDIREEPLIRDCISMTALENARKRLDAMCEDELDNKIVNRSPVV